MVLLWTYYSSLSIWHGSFVLVRLLVGWAAPSAPPSLVSWLWAHQVSCYFANLSSRMFDQQGSVIDATRKSIAHRYRAIADAAPIGSGVGSLNHMYASSVRVIPRQQP